MCLWDKECNLMGKIMDLEAYGKLNVILWDKFSYGTKNALAKLYIEIPKMNIQIYH